MTELVTLDELKEALPNRKNTITQEAVDIINESRNDPEFQGEELLRTAITYESVLKRNKASIPEYLNAIRFCAYLSSEESTFTEAYSKVFSHREFVKQRKNAPTDSTKYMELTSAASRYRKSKLVVDILTVSELPLHLMFAGYRFKAVGILADIMETARLDRDKINAAKELLAATKGPENIKMELDIGVKESSAVQQMNDQLAIMAKRQSDMLEAGISDLKEFGSMKVVDNEDIIDAEYSEK